MYPLSPKFVIKNFVLRSNKVWALDILTTQRTSLKRINQKPSRIPLWSLNYCVSLAVMLEAQLGTTLQI